MSALLDLVGPVCGLGGAVVGGYSLWRSSGRSDKTENRKVDLDALDRTVQRLDAEVERLNETAVEERSARVAAEQETAAERVARKAAEQRAERAEEKVDKIAVSLAAHGQWDLLVLAEVRKHTPDFPEPPTLDLSAAS